MFTFNELQMPILSIHSVDHWRLLTQHRPGADSDGSLGSAGLASDHVQRSANHPARVPGHFAKQERDRDQPGPVGTPRSPCCP